MEFFIVSSRSKAYKNAFGEINNLEDRKCSRWLESEKRCAGDAASTYHFLTNIFHGRSLLGVVIDIFLNLAIFFHPSNDIADLMHPVNMRRFL